MHAYTVCPPVIPASNTYSTGAQSIGIHPVTFSPANVVVNVTGANTSPDLAAAKHPVSHSISQALLAIRSFHTGKEARGPTEHEMGSHGSVEV